MAITHSCVLGSISPLVVSVLLATRAFGSERPKLEDLLKMPLEEMANVRVTVASRFVESQLNSGSTVSVVTEDDWKHRGARRTMEAIDGFYSAGTTGGAAASVACRDVGGVDSFFTMAQGGARYRITANTSAEQSRASGCQRGTDCGDAP